MYEQIREDTIYIMLYAAVTMLSLIASCYLLFRDGNADLEHKEVWQSRDLFGVQLAADRQPLSLPRNWPTTAATVALAPLASPLSSVRVRASQSGYATRQSNPV